MKKDACTSIVCEQHTEALESTHAGQRTVWSVIRGGTLAIALAGIVGCITQDPGAASDSASLAEDTSSPGLGSEPEAESIGVLASSSCTVDLSGTCTTGVVPANATGHFVDITINNRLRPTRCSFQVRDVIADKILFTGIVAANGLLVHRIINVSSEYQLRLFNCSTAAKGSIDNE